MVQQYMVVAVKLNQNINKNWRKDFGELKLIKFYTGKLQDFV